MKCDEWDEAEQLFHELSDLPPDQQRGRLDQQESDASRGSRPDRRDAGMR